MFIETERFGSFEMDDSKAINFPAGLPGFEDLHVFVIIKNKETQPIYWLQSAENKYIALPVIVPFEIISDYIIQIRDDELRELKVECQDDLLITNVVVIPEDVTKMTVNLAAPIVINAKIGVGKQIIIDAKSMPIRFPIYEAMLDAMKGGSEDAGAVAQDG